MKSWLHVVLHLGCVALLISQGYRIHHLQQSELEHHKKALQVRQLFFGCTETLETVSPGIQVDPEFHEAYWQIIGPAPNW